MRERLAGNFQEWIQTASVAEIDVLLKAIGEELVERALPGKSGLDMVRAGLEKYAGRPWSEKSWPGKKVSRPSGVLPTDTYFLDSSDAGQPECRCSRCGEAITEADAPAVRVWPENGRGEWRYHAHCFRVQVA